jgi:hypothetical protein
VTSGLSSLEEARAILPRLQKSYPGAFVVRLDPE